MNISTHNRRAWDRSVEKKGEWTIPVDEGVIATACQGDWHVYLTEVNPAPPDWFPQPIAGKRVLCLASGGGRQGPILAAAGADVTMFDQSYRQLGQDRYVANRDGLMIHLVQGDMTAPLPFANASFDVIVHPVSNAFIPDVRPLWVEAYRVLRRGGVLLAGFMNPIVYAFDFELEEQGIFTIKHPLPYSDLTSISEEERDRLHGADSAYEFGHMLTDQIGGQLDAGFVLTSMYEDYERDTPISKYLPSYIATHAQKS